MRRFAIYRVFGSAKVQICYKYINKIGAALGSERLDRVEHDLREVGFHIIENVITDEEADAAREADLENGGRGYCQRT